MTCRKLLLSNGFLVDWKCKGREADAAALAFLYRLVFSGPQMCKLVATDESLRKK